MIVGLSVFTWIFYSYTGFPQTQFYIIIVTAVYYFLWGNLYHLLEGDFHLKIMVEYLFIAILSIILLRGAIFR